ncbi:uncharacterized protein Z519_09969 [Cladophialophora bantiana CBS 173.52]|uniref:Uncharacterized protein n=1 Tax=Cladophialophora bantiana (strain ATCC 10958 / CBS 173.52 / CDC B-1940 / NIH 8579) TaxID=1442370 RepID=A0A0D2FR91_CLAB1|nr:uncharacterized protein Z519_09969 [Cladophialophora bantiana CBS 173.52]KIW89117.1 hypothetical protein Z519_09969 [Cladophialophora bantiana CBS 173.52]
MALQRYRRKRPRRESSDGYSVEEISADDMGYDGDIEVLLPDQYEEPESDFEDDKALRRLWPDTDDELASKLRRLSCDPHFLQHTRRDDGDRGRKRMSTEMDDGEEDVSLKQTEIEVSELVDGHAEQPPPKKRKNRASKPPAGQRVKKQSTEAWSDSSDRSEEAMDESSTGTPYGANTPSTPVRNAGPDDDGLDAMDLG